MIFETHAHYDDEAFAEDRDELLAKFPEQGITKLVNVGASIQSCIQTIGLMEKYPYVYGALGVHPSDTARLEERDMEWLSEQCRMPKCVAVGEIGLDYHYEEPDRETQRKWFVRQLALAREVGLPVIIHSREAAQDTVAILKDMHAEEIGGVIHCYSYSKELVKDFLEMGFYFGIGGVVTFSNAKKLKEAVACMPLDRIITETDSPYLAPVPERGRRNCSLNLPYVIREIAAIKGKSTEEVEETVYRNACRMYGL